ncbi:MAG: hypothetical protein ACM3KR_10305 [Deltaproteobacteria bacterium]
MNIEERRKQFEEYLERLINEVMFIDSTLELYIHLMNKRIDRINELNMAPAFFGLTINCFLASTVISLAKLYENYNGKNRSDRNICKFLNFIEQNSDIFTQDEETLQKFRCNYRVDSLLIKKHRKLIEDSKSKLDNLFYWRDKCYAHNDKKYFLDSTALGNDAGLTIKSFRELIKLAQDILNDYSIAYSGTYKSIRATNLFDIDHVLDALHDYNQKNADI